MSEENTTAAAGGESSDPGALERAKAELDRAKTCYENLRRQTTERLQAVRKTNVGDIIDWTLNAVKRHPAAGLGLAALAGYFLGRLFRR